MRTYGVEEELLLVDAHSLQPLPAGASAEARHLLAATGHEVTVELQQEQLEVISPPRTTLAEQLEAIRTGRALGAEVAARLGGRVVALPTAPGPVTPHLTAHERYGRMARRFGLTAAEQLTNGFHVHVRIDSRQEGVAVLDRIRVWLPTVLALSANSPFWQGADTGYASYRHQAWSRWPTAGPTDVFGSAAAYDRHREAMLDTRVPLDPAMLYFDARLAEKHPTVEVRVADVSLDAERAAVLATLVRALVETAARNWRRGGAPPAVPASLLALWSWQASHCGVEGRLVDPATGRPAPAAEVVAGLLEAVAPVLAEYGEEQAVHGVVAQILTEGSGATLQRRAYAARGELRDVIAYALATTHGEAGTAPLP